MSIKPEPPCGKVCDERAAGCQAYCKRWKAYEADRAAWYADHAKEIEAKQLSMDYIESFWRRVRARRRNHKKK